MDEKPTILFLQETKCNLTFLEKTAAKAWPGGQVTAVEAQGASGGLAILWDAGKIQLLNIHANKHFIQSIFHLLGTNIYGHITNVYFSQESQQKVENLETLSHLNHDRSYQLWVAGGDFNMIASLEERQGGRCRINRDGSLLKDFINTNWLIDIPTSNGLYTWTNKRVNPMQISSRLDRFLISDNAVHTGGEFIANIVPFFRSDHWPIGLHWNRPGSDIKRPFRFEAFWLSHPEFKDFIQATWKKCNPTAPTKMERFQKKLKMLKEEIKQWNKNTFGNILREKEILIQEIKKIQQKIILEGRSEELAHKEQEAEHKLLDRDLQEEILWRQKSRICWLKEGEKNTKFFHKTTVQRRMSNQISQINNAQGEKNETQAGIEQEFLQYFKAMNQEPNINRTEAIDRILCNIPCLITEDHNTLLLKPISLQEVETAVNLLKAGKAPGPDGFTSNFFQHFWELIQWEVWQVVEESHSMRWMYPGLNATFIALILKSENSNSPEKFRPIALCNIIYKIVSKVVALRLKPLLPLIISPEQSGYVEGRQITDGIILTHEIIHSLKQTKKPGMLLKIDLSKAFDIIFWEYMQKVVKAFGFDVAWIRWISSLISSTFFSILINGTPSSTFNPSRGIHQGDPLSPFLFVIMAEGLGRSIKAAISAGNLKGISIHQSPTTSHQQFVDDNMLFGHSSVQEVRTLNSILDNFSKASGALINKVKSQIFFFNTPPITQRAIARIIGFSVASLPSKYQGAPLIASALKHSSWTNLLEKLETKLFLWTHRALNMANRIVLIKAVLQSMPLYLFSLMAAPKWVLKAIKQLQRNFLWGSSGPNRKWALVKWEKVCTPKITGGIGLRDPEHSNSIMGAKIWWKWLTYPDTPWARLWTAKYASNLPLEEIIRMTEMSKGSAMWNSAIKHRELIQNHSFWEVKEGSTTRFWTDSWQQLPNSTENIQLSLSEELKKRKILKEAGKDKLRWGYEEKGIFTAKEAYKIILKDRLTKDKVWEKIWDPPIWPKISTFLWLLAHNRILSWDNLRKRKFSGPSICLNCRMEEESTVHLMLLCPLGRRLWEKVSFRSRKDGRVQGDIINTLRNWPQKPYQSEILNTLWQIAPGIVMWNIWKERNRRIFKDQEMQMEQVWKIIHNNIQETLSTKCWTPENFPSTPQEQDIWNNWQINIQSPHSTQVQSAIHQVSPSSWAPPPPNTFLLNFDGASKGNSGSIGFGGAIRNSQGIPLTIFYGSIGWNTNNAAELEGLWRGLKIAQGQRLTPLIVEGDSQIIINMVSKIQQGKDVQKVSSSWRLATRLEILQKWLRSNKAISFKHIRREGNKLADFLANLGVDRGEEFFEGSLQGTASDSETNTFKNILSSHMQIRDEDHPDAGVQRAINKDHKLPRREDSGQLFRSLEAHIV
eukprot:PITA_27174